LPYPREGHGGGFCRKISTGRNRDDVCSSVLQCITHFRDALKITVFMDNCSAQNKNWLLYSNMLRAVCCGDFAVECITFKYLQKGHTFISADNDHAKIERAMKLTSKIQDMRDFLKCVEGSRLKVKELLPEDFFQLEEGVSQARLNSFRKDQRPYLAKVKVAEFRKDFPE
jgi:hypothetical protein